MATQPANHLRVLFESATRLSREFEAEAILVWATERIDPEWITQSPQGSKVLLAALNLELVKEASDAGLDIVVIDSHEESILEQIGQASWSASLTT